MKRDRFDDILHSKLQDPEAGYAVPSWNEMERRLVLSENAAGVVRKRSLGRSVKYSIAAAIALLIGFGVYQFGRHSGEMVASLQEGTVSKGGSLPALEQAMKADMIANTEPLNDPALEKLFRSVRSVTPVQPTQSAQNPLHRAMVSAGSRRSRLHGRNRPFCLPMRSKDRTGRMSHTWRKDLKHRINRRLPGPRPTEWIARLRTAMVLTGIADLNRSAVRGWSRPIRAHMLPGHPM